MLCTKKWHDVCVCVCGGGGGGVLEKQHKKRKEKCKPATTRIILLVTYRMTIFWARK